MNDEAYPIHAELEERDRLIHVLTAEAKVIDKGNIRFVAYGIPLQETESVTETIGTLMQKAIPCLEHYTEVRLEDGPLTVFIMDRRVPIPGVKDTLAGRSFVQKLPSSLGSGRGLLLLGPRLSDHHVIEELTHQYVDELEIIEAGGKIVTPHTLNEGFTNYLANTVLSTICEKEMVTPDLTHYGKMALGKLKEAVVKRNIVEINRFICSFIDYPLSESLFAFVNNRFEEENAAGQLYREIVKMSRIFWAVRGEKTFSPRQPEDLPALNRESRNAVILDILGIKDGDTPLINQALANQEIPLEKKLIAWLYLQQIRYQSPAVKKETLSVLKANLKERQTAGAIFDRALGRCFDLEERQKAHFYRDWAIGLLKKSLDQAQTS